MEDEQHVHRPLEHGVHLVLTDLPHHRQEVRRVGQRVVGEEEGEADGEAMAHRGERRRLGDQPQDLLVPAVVVEDLLGVEVEGAEGGDGGDEHSHRVGVVVEAVDEPLAHVLVDERVVGDVVAPRLQLRLVGQLAVQQEIGDLQVRRVLGELLDGIAAVAQDAGIAVEVGDLRLARRRRQVRRVVHEQRRVEIAQRRAGEHPVGDRHRHGLARAVVGDRDGVGHRVPFVAHGTLRGNVSADPQGQVERGAARPSETRRASESQGDE